MAITQDDYSAQRARAYVGQSGDTSPQINESKTVAAGAKFEYGQVAVSSPSGDSFCENFDGSQTFFEGIIPRYFRKAQGVFVDNGGYNHGASISNPAVFSNPDTVDLSIFGSWFVEVEEAITKKGPVAINNKGLFVEPAVGAYLINYQNHQFWVEYWKSKYEK